MDASNNVIGKLQLTLGLSKGSNDTLAITHLVCGLVFCSNFSPFHPFTHATSPVVFYSFTEMNYWNFLWPNSQFSICQLKSLHCSCSQLRHYLCLLLPTKLFLCLEFHQFLVSGPVCVGVLYHWRQHCYNETKLCMCTQVYVIWWYQ